MGNLLAEQWHHRAIRAQHIAETRGNELGVALAALRVNLSDTFGGTHHIGRVDGFVGRNHDEFLHAIFHGQVGHELGAKHVDKHGFVSVLLHERHMLVGCSMEHHLRMVSLKDHSHANWVFHVGDNESHLVAHLLEIGCVVHLKLEVVHRRLGLVEHDEFGGVVMHHLTANLASDGTGSTRDQYHFVIDFAGHVFLAELDGCAAQEVFNLDVFNLVGLDFSIHPF